LVYVASIFLGYLIGSIPSALIIGRLWKGIDIREYGSGNIGTTNTFRVLGTYPAIIVLIADTLKGVAGVLIGSYLTNSEIGAVVGGLAAIAGHNWSVFIKFKGGRGVATAFGILLTITPKVVVILVPIWLLIVVTTKYVSLASLTAAFATPLLMFLYKEPLEYCLFGLIAAIFVIYRHKSNIKRLINREELKVTRHVH